MGSTTSIASIASVVSKLEQPIYTSSLLYYFGPASVVLNSIIGPFQGKMATTQGFSPDPTKGIHAIYLTMGSLNVKLEVYATGRRDPRDPEYTFVHEFDITFLDSNISTSTKEQEPFKANILFTYYYDNIISKMRVTTNSPDYKSIINQPHLRDNYLVGYRFFPLKGADCRIDFIFVFGIKGNARLEVYAEIGGSVNNKDVLSSESLLLQKVENMINLYLSTDVFGGDNLAQCIMVSTKERPISQYLPKVNAYVIGNECTLAEKVITIASRDYQSNQSLNVLISLTTYAVLRYYLWYLITGKFWLGILQNKYTDLFFITLADSPYSNFIEAFESDFLAGYEKYFVYSLV